MRIDIDDGVAPPRAATVGQTLLRAVVGMIVAGHGVEKLIHLRTFQGELIQVGIPSPEIVAFVVLAVELLAGFGLVIGRLTRVCAFFVLCDALAMIAMIGMQHRALELLTTLEASALMAAASFYFLTSGSGVFSADTALRRRARLKALREDEIWQRPPYVAQETFVGPDGVIYDEPVVAYTGDSGINAVDRTHDGRRRFMLRHGGTRD
jgi:putative oxidoreductase